MLRLPLSLFGLLLFSALGPAATHTVAFKVSSGKRKPGNEPVCVPVRLPEKVKDIRKVTIRETGPDKLVAAGQVTAASLVNERSGKGGFELHFILPPGRPSPESTRAFEAVIEYGGPAAERSPAFAWGKDGELRFGDRRVLRYVAPRLDESSPEARTATFKVFHHAYDPTGKVLLTKGVGGLYTHHRGLFYGFMKATYGENTVDTWHCPPPKARNEAHLAHRAVKSQEGGPVLGRQRVEIDWNGIGKKTFARELRELTVYHVPGGTLIEFSSLLRPTGGPVKLNG
jgi:hypothetical protein